jgi:hypothetical protein
MASANSWSAISARWKSFMAQSFCGHCREIGKLGRGLQRHDRPVVKNHQRHQSSQFAIQEKITRADGARKNRKASSSGKPGRRSMSEGRRLRGRGRLAKPSAVRGMAWWTLADELAVFIVGRAASLAAAAKMVRPRHLTILPDEGVDAMPLFACCRSVARVSTDFFHELIPVRGTTRSHAPWASCRASG